MELDMKFFTVIALIIGTLSVLFSAYYGLAFGGIFLENGPVIQGWVGGLVPTFFAVGGTFLIQFSWKWLRVR